MDRSMRGNRIVQVLGPLDLPTIDELRGGFVRLASSGAHTRVGLLPRGLTHWEFAPDLIDQRRDEFVRSAPDVDVDALARLMHDEALPDLPVQIRASRTHLAVLYDHELVDATVAAAFPRALIEMSRGRELPASGDDVSGSLPTALRHTLGLQPRAWWRLASHVRDRRRTVAGATVQPTLPAAEHERVTVRDEANATRHVRSSMDSACIRQLLRWGHRQGLGMGGTLLLLSTAALEQAGIPTSDHGTLIVNLRRYLPRSAAARGNFVTGLPVTTPRRDDDVAVYAREIDAAIESARPLVSAAVSAAKGVLLARSVRHDAGTMPRPTRARVSLSYVGTLRDYERLPWAVEPDARTILNTVDTAAAGDIGWTMLKMHGRLHAVATFRADVLPAERVRAAAALMVADPIGVLADAVGS